MSEAASLVKVSAEEFLSQLPDATNKPAVQAVWANLGEGLEWWQVGDAINSMVVKARNEGWYGDDKPRTIPGALSLQGLINHPEPYVEKRDSNSPQEQLFEDDRYLTGPHRLFIVTKGNRLATFPGPQKQERPLLNLRRGMALILSPYAQSGLYIAEQRARSFGYLELAKESAYGTQIEPAEPLRPSSGRGKKTRRELNDELSLARHLLEFKLAQRRHGNNADPHH